ncbi:sel1 repeat family protein [Acidithiobacillus ferrooxidans]|uniref:sel1 repeat family protein n=1 Tax=Acidithiobacillus ferrooxidans TaxID=920 RepID=UPI001C07CE95|nr:sel1 repeat family protein [Acidithiobacillus ferrooxidans]MBU2857962.1 sel1 repeat family protein [Acidithiobacillus ferrooxidans]
MGTSHHSPIFVSTQTAAQLTGKSVRTIHNWLESGGILGKEVKAAHIPGGLMRRIDLSSIGANVQTEMTDGFLECVRQADAGDADGMNNVATYFYRSKEYRIAVGWFEAAAKKGHADAMELLSMCYVNGLGVEKNQVLGVQWLGKAAALGHSVAKAKLQALGFEV